MLTRGVGREPELQRMLGYEGSVGMRAPMDVVRDRLAGRSRSWVHPEAAVPGVSKAGEPLPPNTKGERRVDSGPHEGATRVGVLGKL